VIYTGGINPLLWRPLTGIYSFNIPPYTFDLSPFAGLLNDRKNHVLGLRVLGNNPEGSWFVDPVLRLNFAQPDLSASDAMPLLGKLMYHRGPETSVNVTASSEPYLKLGFEFHTQGLASLRVAGSVGDVVCTVESTLSAFNQNSVSLEVGVTAGSMISTSSSTIESPGDSAQTTVVERHYPYEVVSSYVQTAEDFEIYGYVNYSAKIKVTSKKGSVSSPLSWELSMTSNATYNRTNDYVYNVETDKALARFMSGSEESEVCFEQRFAAVDGYVVEAADEDSCSKADSQDQQLKLCGAFDACAPTPVNVTTSNHDFSAAGRTEKRSPLLFRSPRVPDGNRSIKAPEVMREIRVQPPSSTTVL
jgi:hypothetical protein